MWVVLETPYVHPKNRRGIELLAAEAGARVLFVQTAVAAAIVACDLLWIPSRCIDPKFFPQAARILYGPHNFVFPEKEWVQVRWTDPRCAYICLSDWVRNAYAARGGVAGLPLVLCPFPVDVERFRPAAVTIEEKRGCLLYVKQRRQLEVEWAKVCLAAAGIPYTEIHYGSYKEEDYVKALHSVQFCVWVGRAESQGFALQEALATNIPMVVWSVEQMGQEIGASGIPMYKGSDAMANAVTVPYWDERCGVVIQRGRDLPAALAEMVTRRETFTPRKFILETLGPRACLERWHKEIPGGLQYKNASDNTSNGCE